MLAPAPPRRFLFLQGPSVPVFAETGARLRELGHAVWRINLCLGDKLLPGTLSAATRTELGRAESPTAALALLLVSPDFMWR